MTAKSATWDSTMSRFKTAQLDSSVKSEVLGFECQFFKCQRNAQSEQNFRERPFFFRQILQRIRVSDSFFG